MLITDLKNPSFYNLIETGYVLLAGKYVILSWTHAVTYHFGISRGSREFAYQPLELAWIKKDFCLAQARFLLEHFVDMKYCSSNTLA